MPDPERPEAAMLDEWLQATSSSTNEAPRDDPTAIVRGVLNRLDNDGVELPHHVVYACVVLLSVARTDLDRLELGLMRAASEHGNSWSWIAETFGHRSKQAAHARASALHRRLEYRTLDEEENR
ncbi:hypothetical protein BFN03_18880 [Rhodococcus sp. WMMA185]|uniref:hypothetical protein n=1 Tax=Rhodococcus sp. WMMA185 TaxID=679318 RepID=UPI000878AA10|nr:hypothetical protein [Rhodococcus sp. WMMA185]AOW94033.1 hypothetical protein BFN03_18880 [Rhodococcus sp. WMMA185]